ncbi:hypothetical protein QVD17_07574 [Tagetes erecta]|uniref:Transmembrane protein n=1 Tax=Tagetes erecta TaxID=13708 RepID=A0AAD8PCX6_TARER|nr:hypothetical protein QVD17_07574 [Tagetes erecta]
MAFEAMSMGRHGGRHSRPSIASTVNLNNNGFITSFKIFETIDVGFLGIGMDVVVGVGFGFGLRGVGGVGASLRVGVVVGVGLRVGVMVVGGDVVVGLSTLTAIKICSCFLIIDSMVFTIFKHKHLYDETQKTLTI